MTEAVATGTLYIVATPIGNLNDISERAINTLKTVDFILAEDTRHSSHLLLALGIHKKLVSLHAHNEEEKSKHLIDELESGLSVALISDAGTPLISDPGFPLVKLAREKGISVVPIPGPCALITALSAAGVPCDSFLFIGFLPAKHTARLGKLELLSHEPHTVIFYESTHRILDCLEDMSTAYGDECHIVLAKELTKHFERFVQGPIRDIRTWLLSDINHTKGEFVLIIPPRPVVNVQHEQEKVLKVLLAELPLKQAVALTCKITDGNKNELYDKALALTGKNK
jgi:16S rRNA (cytidine1402-2'-O)-methyltransferase